MKFKKKRRKKKRKSRTWVRFANRTFSKYKHQEKLEYRRGRVKYF